MGDEDIGEDGAQRQGTPGPAFSRELYLAWRNPRRGDGNPTPIDSPVWAWLIRSGFGSYRANRHFAGPASGEAGPCWSWERYGQSCTRLPDGRAVYVAGEHEDSYDPDFYIYNDVVVRHPDGRIELFVYADEVFPPTDFHSATLVAEDVYLVGSLGYRDRRRIGCTQVLRLDTRTWAVHAVATTGEGPGWIHGHRAVLGADGRSIDLEGGEVELGAAAGGLVENVEVWRLHLSEGRWERRTWRNWPRYEMRRADGTANLLWEMRQVRWNRDMGWPLYPAHARLPEAMGTSMGDADAGRICFDERLLASLYTPGMTHETLPVRDDEYGVHRIRVDGVVVRYLEDHDAVRMTVEGDLPSTVEGALAEDLRAKLGRLERTPYQAVRRAP